MGQLFALLFAVNYGLSNVFASKAIETREIDKFTGLYITLFINSMISITVFTVYLLSGAKIAINLTGIVFFGIAGFLNSFLTRGVFFMAIPYIGVSRAGIFKITSPIYAILGGVLILNEVMKGKALIGAITIFTGIIFISLETIREKHKEDISVLNSVITMPKKGIGLGLLSGFFLGTGNIFRKLGIIHIPNSILGASVGSLVAFFAILIFQLVKGKKQELFLAIRDINRDYFLSGAFSSVALYCLFVALYFIPVSYANSISASESLFTMFWSLVLCGKKEILTVRTFIGAVIIIIGINFFMML